MELKEINNTIFESIKHIDEEGCEYWSARELQKILEYNKWQNFSKVIKSAIESCDNSDNNLDEHFTEVSKVLKVGNKANMSILDYKLSRYACYLIAMNGDSRKKVIALAQTYFAIQTRRQELLEKDYDLMTEDEKRLFQRNLIKKSNKTLNRNASNRGVKNLDKFHNAGYKGLYNGETAADIFKRKKLRYREDILDNMGSSELIANLFRIDQTNQRLQNDNIIGEKSSCETHYEVGKNVRDVIIRNKGTLPEDLPTPNKSLKELDKYNDEIIKK